MGKNLQPPVSSFYLNLFKTITIGLKSPTNLFYVWTRGLFLWLSLCLFLWLFLWLCLCLCLCLCLWLCLCLCPDVGFGGWENIWEIMYHGATVTKYVGLEPLHPSSIISPSLLLSSTLIFHQLSSTVYCVPSLVWCALTLVLPRSPCLPTDIIYI